MGAAALSERIFGNLWPANRPLDRGHLSVALPPVHYVGNN